MTDIPLVDLTVHHAPRDMRDRIAFGFTKTLRWCADTFFAKRYGHRAIVLETVAAVRHGRRDHQPPQMSAPHVRRQGLDTHPDGGGGE